MICGRSYFKNNTEKILSYGVTHIIMMSKSANIANLKRFKFLIAETVEE